MADRQAERAALKKVVNDTTGIDALRKVRRVAKYSDFPHYTKAVYCGVAACYPGAQVYACGSRVRGDYMDWVNMENTDGFTSKEVLQARADAGMMEKYDSDFDYWVEPEYTYVSELPTNTDRCRVRVPENEKIPLPMWDFSKLPESEHENVKRLLQSNDIQGLVRIHDKYGLSEYQYCCSGVEGVKNWFNWAVETGAIK